MPPNADQNMYMTDVFMLRLAVVYGCRLIALLATMDQYILAKSTRQLAASDLSFSWFSGFPGCPDVDAIRRKHACAHVQSFCFKLKSFRLS